MHHHHVLFRFLHSCLPYRTPGESIDAAQRPGARFTGVGLGIIIIPCDHSGFPAFLMGRSGKRASS